MQKEGTVRYQQTLLDLLHIILRIITYNNNSCHDCQISGKAGQHTAETPSIPIHVMSKTFQKTQIDCVGPLNPRLKVSMYLLTLICTATRYPEAFLLWNIKVRSICNTLKNIILPTRIFQGHSM